MKKLLKSISGLRILVVGDLMVDHYIWGDAHRISPEAPVPVVGVEKESSTLGAAANVALNLRSLGCEVDLCGVSGKDATGNELATLLTEKGITLANGFAREGLHTILKTRVIVRNQQLCRLDREQAPKSYRVDWAKDGGKLCELVENCDAVIISDYSKGVVTEELIAGITEAAHAKEKIVALDPKPRRKLNYKNVDLLTPNRSEALELAGIELEPGEDFPADEVASAIWEKHAPKHLVITLGADGMLLCENGKVFKTMQTYALEVFDVSGAGDTVVAALTAALATGVDIEGAAHFANNAAGVVVAKLGTATATPEEILEHAEQFDG